MNPLDREDIHILARHSNWSAVEIENQLAGNVRNDKNTWEKFLQYFFLSLGIGLASSGVIFFFAYNWENLHKFAKLGLVQALIAALVLGTLWMKRNETIQNILLTGATLLVGALFAVFGQIYQTGANAYDFFLGWTIFVSLWVWISDFAPLWLLYIALINTTFFLYHEQVIKDWEENTFLLVLMLINGFFLLSSYLVPRILKTKVVPTWFSYLLALAVAYLATFQSAIFIIEPQNQGVLGLILSLLIFTAFAYAGYKGKSIFYLSLFAICALILATTFLVKLSHDAFMFLFICVFVVACVTLIVKLLLRLQKQWKEED